MVIVSVVVSVTVSLVSEVTVMIRISGITMVVVSEVVSSSGNSDEASSSGAGTDVFRDVVDVFLSQVVPVCSGDSVRSVERKQI